MENLTLYKSQSELQHAIENKLISIVSRLLLKIKIELSADQFKTMNHLMADWLFKSPLPVGLEEKALYYDALMLYNSKIVKASFNLKKRVKLSINISQAYTIIHTIGSIELPQDSYELTVCNYIIGQIDKQA
ncbi:MAG: hypothetical protein U1C59_11450 [Methylotenera sp.]|nr:hypothetical protein [Methylotenera sp.]